MNSVVRLFYTLIQISLGHRGISDFNPTVKQWYALFHLAKMQTLVGVLYVGIKRLDSTQLPPKELLFKWYALYNTIISSNKTVNKKAIELQQRFFNDGFKNVVMKGQGIAMLYDVPLARNCGDIDFWFEGDRAKIVSYIQPQCEEKRVVYHNINYSASKDVPVEIHFTPSWMFSYFTNRKLQKFFSQSINPFSCSSVDLPDNAGNLKIPSLSFNRVFILVHIYRHLFGEGIGLRQVMDYCYVLKQGFTETEREETLKVLRNLKMLNFTKGIMFILHNVFGLEEKYLLTAPDVKHGQFLLAEIMRAGNFGHYDKTISTTESDSMLSLFIKRSKRNLRFISYYPSEVVWCPLFKMWHFCWRKYHGWL